MIFCRGTGAGAGAGVGAGAGAGKGAGAGVGASAKKKQSSRFAKNFYHTKLMFCLSPICSSIFQPSGVPGVPASLY